jgi:hypothetical protein
VQKHAQKYNNYSYPTCFSQFSYLCILILSQVPMIKPSVNINKIATLRNARGGDVPDLVKTAVDIERFGTEGITVHPRPDERHIRYADVYALMPDTI